MKRRMVERSVPWVMAAGRMTDLRTSGGMTARWMAAGVLMAAVLLTGCGGRLLGSSWTGGENGIYVTDRLEVRSAMVYTAEAPNERYDSQELADFAKEWIAGYNQASGARAASVNERGQEKLPVALRSSSLKGETGTLVLDYGAPEHFVAFARETGDDTHTVTALAVNRVGELQGEDGFAGASFKKADGSAAKAGEVAGKSRYGAVAVEGAATIHTQGSIAYVSAEGVTVRDKHTAETGEGLHYIVFR